MEETSSQDAYEKWLIQSHLFIMTRDELRSFQRNLTAILAKSYCSGGIPTWIFWLWALRKYFFERAKHHYLPKTLRVPFMEFVLRANAATLHSGSWPRLLPVRIGLKQYAYAHNYITWSKTVTCVTFGWRKSVNPLGHPQFVLNQNYTCNKT